MESDFFAGSTLSFRLLFPIKKGRVRGRGVDMRKYFMKFLKEEQGQSTIEYILMLAIVVLIAMKFKGQFMEQMTKTINRVGGQIDEATSGQ